MPWIMKQGRRGRNPPRPVVQYDMDGSYIRDWPSARIACETLGIDNGLRKNGQPKAPAHIVAICNNPNEGIYAPIPGAAHGFRWAYKETT